MVEAIVDRRQQKHDRKCTTYKQSRKSSAKLYKPLRPYQCICAEGECARPRTHLPCKREKTSWLVLTYFFLGPASLGNLEDRLLDTLPPPLGEATAPQGGSELERDGGLNSALAAVFAFFHGWCLAASSGLESKLEVGARFRFCWVSST